MDFNPLREIIEGNQNFVLTTHVNPDADAIGSQTALYLALKKLGKTAKLINFSQTPDNLLFLDVDNIIEQYSPEEHDEIILNTDIIFMLDLNQATRVVKMGDILRKSTKPVVCIDHHQDPDDLPTFLFTDEEACATSEILYRFFEETGIVELDTDIANSLYSGIMTDTGSFRYERTSSYTHYVASKLLEYNIDPNELYISIFEKGNVNRLNLLGIALASLKLVYDGRLCYMTIRQSDLGKTGANESDVDGFVNYCMTIAGVQIGLLFFELKDGLKVSFRSRGDIPINKLAGEFNGGGHFNASGARLFDKELNSILPEVLDAADKYLQKV